MPIILKWIKSIPELTKHNLLLQKSSRLGNGT